MSAARCVNADDAPAGAVRSPARSEIEELRRSQHRLGDLLRIAF
jgi:hypothetical protein